MEKEKQEKRHEGNDAIHLYEKYGFRMNAHLLVCNRYGKDTVI